VESLFQRNTVCAAANVYCLIYYWEELLAPIAGFLLPYAFEHFKYFAHICFKNSTLSLHNLYIDYVSILATNKHGRAHHAPIIHTQNLRTAD
jgi:hypothetical protein